MLAAYSSDRILMRFSGNRQRYPALRSLFAFIALGVCCTSPLPADAILDLTFDDPQGLIKTKPEGISEITSEFNGSKTTITSGNGGRSFPQIASGPPEEHIGKPPDVKIQVLSEPSMGTPAFLRLILSEDGVTRGAYVGILPEGVEHSLAALVTYEGGHTVINGGFDFFFRSSADGGSQPKIVLGFKCGPLSFTAATNPNGAAVLIKAGSNKKVIDLDGDGVGEKTALERWSGNEIFLESGAIYHAAVVFRTSPEGAITMEVCFKPGTGPLKTEESFVASIGPFWLTAKDSPASTDKIVLGIGRSQFAQTFDLAAFRIFKPAPSVFPGIDGKQ